MVLKKVEIMANYIRETARETSTRLRDEVIARLDEGESFFREITAPTPNEDEDLEEHLSKFTLESFEKALGQLTDLVSIRAEDKKGLTALCHAAEKIKENWEVIILLIKSGAKFPVAHGSEVSISRAIAVLAEAERREDDATVRALMAYL